MRRVPVAVFIAAHPWRVLRQLTTDHLRLCLSQHSLIEGFHVHIANYIVGVDEARDRLEAALQLLASVDMKRFRRMQRDLRRILVSDVATSGYSFPSNTCVLQLRLLRTKSAGTVALVLVHEATHARLYHAGIVTWQRIQARVERACVRQQIGFVRQLTAAGWGGGDKMINALEHALSDPWWTRKHQFELRLRALTESDLPRWIVRAWSWLHKPASPP